MLDLKRIREDPDAVRTALARRGEDAVSELEQVIGLDAARRALLPELEGLRAEQNEANARIQGASDPAEREREIAAMRSVAARVKELERELGEVEERLQAALAPLPNLPDPTAAPGPEDELVREVGAPPELGFRAARSPRAGRPADRHGARRGLSGARFAYLRGELVMLELALVRWALEVLAGHGFEPVIPPVLVRERALYGTGFLPDTEQQIYTLPEDELYPGGHLRGGPRLAPRRRDPRGRAACRCATPASHRAFAARPGPPARTPAGSSACTSSTRWRCSASSPAEDSLAEHERILAIEEELLQALGLPYRVMNIAVGELGNSAAKKYDCEAWLPSQDRYRELTSCSNTTDYQARRLNIRARRQRPGGGRSVETVHTLNGTAVAVGRTIVALLENGQRQDGSVRAAGGAGAVRRPRRARAGRRPRRVAAAPRSAANVGSPASGRSRARSSA